MRADAGVDRADDLEAGLDRAQASQRLMQMRRVDAAEPGIVGDVREEVRLPLRLLADVGAGDAVDIRVRDGTVAAVVQPGREDA